MDKTGTLTEGRFRLQKLKHDPACGSVERVMQLAASVEAVSSHPIAAAFLEFANSLEASPLSATEFTLIEGEGVSAVVDGVTVHVGGERLVRRIESERPPRTAKVLEAEAAHAANAGAE